MTYILNGSMTSLDMVERFSNEMNGGKYKEKYCYHRVTGKILNENVSVQARHQFYLMGAGCGVLMVWGGSGGGR